MPISASPVWDAWSELSTRLPSDLDLDALALSTKAIQRHRGDGVTDGATLSRLCLARGPGGKSLQETAVWAHLNGLAELGGQSLNERLHQSVAFLAGIVHRLLMGRVAGKPLLWAGRCLRIADGSSLSRRGGKGTDWRLHGVYDLERGGFCHLEVTDRTGAESLLRCAPVTGEVLLADRGYAKAKELRACLAPSASGRRDFIVRVGWKALALRNRAGRPFSLIAQLKKPRSIGPVREWSVQAVVGSARQHTLLPIRLIAMPLPADKVEAKCVKLRRNASKHGEALNPNSLVAAGFMVLVTSLPAEIPAAEICAAYRLRWQAELAFKRLKSLIHLDRLHDPNDGGQPELAVRPPDPGSADRRHLPGFPGIFPLRTLQRTGGDRRGGLPAWRSTRWLAHCPPSRPSARVLFTRMRTASTDCSADPYETGGKGKTFSPAKLLILMHMRLVQAIAAATPVASGSLTR